MCNPTRCTYTAMYVEAGQWRVAGEFRSYALAWIVAKLARLFYGKAGIYHDLRGGAHG